MRGEAYAHPPKRVQTRQNPASAHADHALRDRSACPLVCNPVGNRSAGFELL